MNVSSLNWHTLNSILGRDYQADKGKGTKMCSKGSLKNWTIPIKFLRIFDPCALKVEEDHLVWHWEPRAKKSEWTEIPMERVDHFTNDSPSYISGRFCPLMKEPTVPTLALPAISEISTWSLSESKFSLTPINCLRSNSVSLSWFYLSHYQHPFLTGTPCCLRYFENDLL